MPHLEPLVDIDQATRIAMECMLHDPSPGDLLCAEYTQYQELDFDTYNPGKPPNLDPGLVEYAEIRARELVVEDIARVEEQIDADGMLTIYRAMVVDRQWLDEERDGTGLGTCWAWTLDCAASHHGGGGDIEVRMRGKVPLTAIEWDITIGLNAGDDYMVGTENEIRLRPDAIVDLESIEWRSAGSLYDSEYSEYEKAAYAVPG